MPDQAPSHDNVEVHVTFAAAAQPYHQRFDLDTTVAVVLQEALTFFGYVPDGATRYYLVFNGTEQTGTEAIGVLVEHGRSLKFSLRTETISG